MHTLHTRRTTEQAKDAEDCLDISAVNGASFTIICVCVAQRSTLSLPTPRKNATA